MVSLSSFLVVLLSCHLSYGSLDNLRKLAVANNDLALRLHKRLSDGTSENVFFSPLSVSTAFGMLFYGAKGSTADELRNTLGYSRAGLSDNLVHTSFNDLLYKSTTNREDEYTLNIANAVLLDKYLDAVPSYKSDISDIYKALVRDVDFAQNAAEVAKDINEWVKTNTNGKIDHLVDELDASTVMVVLNAVYFKGVWKTKFDPRRTNSQEFYNGGLESNVKKIPMMHTIAEFPYIETKEMKVLELPYDGEHVSMYVLLPNKRDGLAKLEQSLTLENLSKIQNKMYKQEVIAALPKFKLEYSRELSSDFRALGAESIFKAGVADFSGIANDKSIAVSEILHKAVVEVNEEGSEASGVTGIIMNRFGREDNIFVADHPFLFAIVDKKTDIILFVGRVSNL